MCDWSTIGTECNKQAIITQAQNMDEIENENAPPYNFQIESIHVYKIEWN